MASMVQCLVCAKCGRPAATQSSLVAPKALTVPKTVYAYELAVLGVDCWCYSVTASDDQRFDLVRAQPLRLKLHAEACHDAAAATVFAAGAEAGGLPSVASSKDFPCGVDASWFTGYRAVPIYCMGCLLPHQLGWGFSHSATQQPEFLALILTRLRERQLDVQAQEFLAAAAPAYVRQSLQIQVSLARWATAVCKDSSAAEYPAELKAAAEAALLTLRELHSQTDGRPMPPELSAVQQRLRQSAAQGAAVHSPTARLPQAPRGPLTTGQASIVGMRRRNVSQPGSTLSFAGLEAARERQRRDAEEPWLNRYLGAMQHRTTNRAGASRSSSAADLVRRFPVDNLSRDAGSTSRSTERAGGAGSPAAPAPARRKAMRTVSGVTVGGRCSACGRHAAVCQCC
eukprot:TRINITY_DN46932_c0_g1_i1.p1 TRINITY_DN46932_c0_g1~~TRINITY_DN46932_c0_g1_i1.p1  ORF type:complete len:399 (-),score=72.55 TRINITY_DN46932_c0_g1_i1:298-1494(-)